MMPPRPREPSQHEESADRNSACYKLSNARTKFRLIAGKEGNANGGKKEYEQRNTAMQRTRKSDKNDSLRKIEGRTKCRGTEGKTS